MQILKYISIEKFNKVTYFQEYRYIKWYILKNK